jgi:putative redox protein
VNVAVSAKLTWRDQLNFNVEVGEGRKIQLNSAHQMGQAFTPMELFLVALVGCTAMDIQWILSRQRQKLDKLEISARGIRREEDPRYYERIDMEYTVGGQNIKRNAVERAIRLSQEKYCSVRAMLKDTVKLNISYTIANGERAPQKFTYEAPANPR